MLHQFGGIVHYMQEDRGTRTPPICFHYRVQVKGQLARPVRTVLVAHSWQHDSIVSRFSCHLLVSVLNTSLSGHASMFELSSSVQHTQFKMTFLQIEVHILIKHYTYIHVNILQA